MTTQQIEKINFYLRHSKDLKEAEIEFRSIFAQLQEIERTAQVAEQPAGIPRSYTDIGFGKINEGANVLINNTGNMVAQPIKDKIEETIPQPVRETIKKLLSLITTMCGVVGVQLLINKVLQHVGKNLGIPDDAIENIAKKVLSGQSKRADFLQEIKVFKLGAVGGPLMDIIQLLGDLPKITPLKDKLIQEAEQYGLPKEETVVETIGVILNLFNAISNFYLPIKPAAFAINMAFLGYTQFVQPYMDSLRNKSKQPTNTFDAEKSIFNPKNKEQSFDPSADYSQPTQSQQDTFKPGMDYSRPPVTYAPQTSTRSFADTGLSQEQLQKIYSA